VTDAPTDAASARRRADPILAVENLRTTFETDKETIRAVDGIDLDVYPGETVGLVGESGSGKSVTARSIMGLIDAPGRIDPDSSIRFDGEELTGRSEAAWSAVRGSGIAMVFQDPLSRLNPVYTVGNQITESLRLHRGLSGAAATAEAIELLEAVGIADAPRRLDEHPHEFSGGMRQRAVIAMALACDPEVLIADEPTTALDVTTQAQILELLDRLQAERDLAILFITHDMGVIAEVCDRVNVMYAGEIVETAAVEELFTAPAHPYTRGLLASVPSAQSPTRRLRTIEGEVPTPTDAPTACRFAPRCPQAFEDCERTHPPSVNVTPTDPDHTVACLLYPEDRDADAAGATGDETGRDGHPDDPDRRGVEAAVTGRRSSSTDADDRRRSAPADETLVEVRDLETHYEAGATLFETVPVKAVDGVTFDIRRGETLGLVGESGCGKTTLGRTLLGLERATGGTVRYDGQDVTEMTAAERQRWRRNVGMVFQDPESSLNERLTVGEIVREPLDVHDWETPRRRRERVRDLLDTVGLQPEHYHRYPHQFSGGQRQRIAIARALALNPEFLVLDEPVSALDVSVQAQVLNLLEDLQAEYGLTYLLIAHDLSVVRHVCDRVAVMYLGTLLERGDTAALFEEPANPYTISLLSAVPTTEPTGSPAETDRITLRGEPPTPRDPPSGCPFSTRCPMKIRPPAFEDLDDDLFERIETLRTVLRERARADRSLTERVAALLGRDATDADAAELRRDLFGDVTLPPTARRPVDEALAKLDAGELGAARRVLADAFDSDCDTVMPDAHRVGPADRTSWCHRHREAETDPRSAVDRARYALESDTRSDE
jgi:oligopeptide/dipeptide ABC transporter ATP-binding protein